MLKLNLNQRYYPYLLRFQQSMYPMAGHIPKEPITRTSDTGEGQAHWLEQSDTEPSM
jgi:hypothetical protein